MTNLRRRWRLVVGVILVGVVILAGVLTDSAGFQAGVTLGAFFLIIVLIITGVRKGGGGTSPWHHQGGNTGNGL